MAVVGSAEIELTPELARFVRDVNDLSDDPRLRRVGFDMGENVGRGASDGFVDEFEPPSQGRLGGFAGRLVVALGAALAAAGIGRLIGNSISEASDLGEAASKVGVVFGDAAGEVEAFAESAVGAFGLAESEALGFTGTLGNLLLTTGLNEDAVADMSTILVGLAADLGSFNNVETSDALEALRAGLVGETEPLKRFGVNMNEATLKAQALSLGLLDAEVDTRKLADAQESITRKQQAYADAVDKFGDNSEQARRATFDLEKANDALAKVLDGKVPTALDAATKAQAAYSLILEQTTTAQGDFGRTLESSLPNQLKVAGAGFDSLQGQVGEALLPVALEFVKAINEEALPALGAFAEAIIPAFEPLDGLVEPIVGGLVGGLGFVTDLIEELPPRIAEVRDFIDLAGASFSNAFNGVNVNADGVLGFIANVGDAAGEATERFEPIGAQIVAALTDGFNNAVPFLQDAFAAVIEFVEPIFASLSETLAPIFDGLGGDILASFGDIADRLGPVFADLAPVLAEIGDLFLSQLGANADGFGGIIDAIIPAISQFVSVLGELAADVLPIVAEILGAVLPVLSEVRGVFLDFAAAVIPPLIAALGEVIPLLADIGGEVIGVLVAAFSDLAPIITEVASVFADTLLDLLPTIVGLFETLAPVIAELAPVLAEVLGTLATVGLESLAEGFVSVLPLIGELADIIAGPLADALVDLGPVIGQVASVLGGVLAQALPVITRLFSQLAPIVTRILPPLGELVGSLVGAFGDVLLTLGDAAAEVIEALEPVIDVVIELADIIVDNLIPIITDLADAGVLQSLAESFGQIAVAAAELLAAVAPLLIPIAELLGFFASEAAAPLVLALAEAIAFLAEVLTDIITTVADVVGAIIGWFTYLYDVLVGNSIVPELIFAIVEFFALLPIELLKIVGDLIVDLVAKFGELLDETLTFFGDLPDDILDALGDVIDDVVGVFDDIYDGVIGVVESLFDDVVEFFTELPGELIGLIGDLLGAGTDLGEALIDGFVDGLSGAVGIGGAVLDILGDAFTQAWNVFVDTINAGAPDKIDLPGPVDINLPNNPFDFLKLASGGIVSATAGGTAAIIGEGGQDEAVIPLPDGLIEGLRRIADGSGTGGGGLSIGQIVAPSPERAAAKVVTEWRKGELLKG